MIRFIVSYIKNISIFSARKNYHKFPSEADERKYFIYNHPLTYTGLNEKIKFLECYLFNSSETEMKKN